MNILQIEDLKKLRGQTGIYGFVDLDTDVVFYVGRSSNIYRRIQNQLSALNSGKCDRPVLAHEYSARRNVGFTVLEQTINDTAVLMEREAYWIEYYQPLGNLQHTSKYEEHKRKTGIREKITRSMAGNLNALGHTQSEQAKQIKGEKSKAAWQRDPERKAKQAQLMARLNRERRKTV